MNKTVAIAVLTLLPSLLALQCANSDADVPAKQPASVAADSGKVSLVFSFEINRQVYDKTNFGEPPQIAVWIEHSDSQQRQTVWVTRRAGQNDWKGKVECPVALPFWEAHMGLRNSDIDAARREVMFDAVTGATPKEGRFSAAIRVPEDSRWRYFIEVNGSADYNKDFPFWVNGSIPDFQANGQPSLVYGGEILADGSSSDVPRLLGRTEQLNPADRLSEDLESITTAKELLSGMAVHSRKK